MALHREDLWPFALIPVLALGGALALLLQSLLLGLFLIGLCPFVAIAAILRLVTPPRRRP